MKNAFNATPHPISFVQYGLGAVLNQEVNASISPLAIHGICSRPMIMP